MLKVLLPGETESVHATKYRHWDDSSVHSSQEIRQRRKIKVDKAMPFTSLKKNYMWFEGITWDGSLF